ncbi:MAG: AI-2E family transporter [Nanoarchaeota archaeon]
MREDDKFEKYVFWSVIVVLFALSYFILRPYLIALMSSFILAYLVKPLYDRLVKKLGKSLSALACILIVIVVIILPIGIVVGGITQQAYLYISENSIDRIIEPFVSYFELEKFGIGLKEFSEKGAVILISLLGDVISYLPAFLLSVFITLFGMYYVLVDWDVLASRLQEYLPFRDKRGISREISDITNSLVYGTLLIGIIEFVVAVAGFYFSGVRLYFLLSALVFLFAFIPGGPGIVWIPLFVYYLAAGNYFSAVGVLAVGLILSFVVDTLLRGKILGAKTRINPLIMILGILGGVGVFGIFGFIIGPLILFYAIRLFEEGVRRY